MIKYYTMQPPASLAIYLRMFWVLKGLVSKYKRYKHEMVVLNYFFITMEIVDALLSSGKGEKQLRQS